MLLTSNPDDWLIYKQIGTRNLKLVKGVTNLITTETGFEFKYQQGEEDWILYLHYNYCEGKIFTHRLKVGKELEYLFQQLDTIRLEKMTDVGQ